MPFSLKKIYSGTPYKWSKIDINVLLFKRTIEERISFILMNKGRIETLLFVTISRDGNMIFGFQSRTVRGAAKETVKTSHFV